MQKLLLISILLLLFFSGCSSTYQIEIQNFSNLFINDSEITTNYTYSSFKIEELISNINSSSNNTIYYAGEGLYLNLSNYFNINNTYIENLVNNLNLSSNNSNYTAGYGMGINSTNFAFNGNYLKQVIFEDFGYVVATYQRITTAPTIDVTTTSQTGTIMNFPSAATALSDGGYVMAGGTATNLAIINASKIRVISARARLTDTTSRADIIGAFKTATTVVQATSKTGVFFHYNVTQGSTIYGYVCSTGVCQNVSGITADTSWHEYTIESNANSTNPATQYTFYIDGVNKGTISTVPTTQISTIGTWTEATTASARTLQLDWYYLENYR